MKTEIITERLILRPWENKDLIPFAAINADSKVREFFLATLSTQESHDLVHKISLAMKENGGWGFWCAALKETDECIGMIGLNPVTFDVPFAPAIEIGWRLAADHWGKGLATEGAFAALNFAFNTLKLPEIVAFTAVQNVRSRHIMEKLSMIYCPEEDFDHPLVPDNHPLKRHVLYRIN